MIRCYSLIQSGVAGRIGGQGSTLGRTRRVVVRGGGGGVVSLGGGVTFGLLVHAGVVCVWGTGLQLIGVASGARPRPVCVVKIKFMLRW